MAASDQSNPVEDLDSAATANLLSTTNDSNNALLSAGAKHLGMSQAAQVAAHVSAESRGRATAVASNRSGTSVWLDHSVKQKQSRKRSREEALGRNKDCPTLQRVCWKWAGETTAASACWLVSETDGCSKASSTEGLPKTEFKCAVVMQGEDVLQGLQALIDAGLAEAPLPDFLRNAPSMGGTIRVDHGSYVSSDTPFEAV